MKNDCKYYYEVLSNKFNITGIETIETLFQGTLEECNLYLENKAAWIGISIAELKEDSNYSLNKL